MLRKILQTLASKSGLFRRLYIKLYVPEGEPYADFLRSEHFFHAQGAHCSILHSTYFTDPKYVELGNNVQFATCTIIGHDGSNAMLNRAYNLSLEGVGPVRIKDNVFIGHNAILMPNVTIGPNAIVAAGAVVTQDVPPGTIVAGTPARVIGNIEDLVQRRIQQTAALPWADLLAERGIRGFDPQLEPELVRRRIEHFFPQP